jgi:hypothetical protein
MGVLDPVSRPFRAPRFRPLGGLSGHLRASLQLGWRWGATAWLSQKQVGHGLGKPVLGSGVRLVSGERGGLDGFAAVLILFSMMGWIAVAASVCARGSPLGAQS